MLPRWVCAAPLVVGAVLAFVAFTAPTSRIRTLVTGGPLAGANAGSTADLRSQYEEQIRLSARQEERARLARDLHDAVKQQLFVIHTAAATAEARFENDSAGAKVAVDQVRTASREAVVEMQALIEQLQAAPMENVGLVEALRQQCEALGFRTGAKVNLIVGKLPPSDALPPGAQLTLFRAAQEALSNAARHARARQVDVTLEMNADQLHLSIRDDGAGFDPNATERGLGLRNMAERARELGGSFTLNSRPGEGTSIRLSAPCSQTSPDRYARRALGWAGVLAVFAVLGAQWGWQGAIDRPWTVGVAAMIGIMVVRHAVAYYRVRQRSVP